MFSYIEGRKPATSSQANSIIRLLPRILISFWLTLTILRALRTTHLFYQVKQEKKNRKPEKKALPKYINPKQISNI